MASGALRISAVIPTFREAARIAEAVGCARQVADEVLVVDGGSPDGTAEAATRAGARLLMAPRGRGAQLDAGARAAHGDVLLFLHADARLPPEARPAMLRALAAPSVVGGNFLVRFDPPSFAAAVFSLANDLRRRWLRIYYGDSALFVRRHSYKALGGFRRWPLFEDYEFVGRLERHGPTAYIREIAVEVSARRFAGAPLRTLALWTSLQMLYSAGVSPARLAVLYRDLR